MSFHKDLVTGDIHRLHDQEYATTTARDADTTWNGNIANIGKMVKVVAGPVFFLLEDNAPTWLEITTSVSQSLAGALAIGNITGGTDIVVETGDAVTLIDAPSAGTDAVNKTYVDGKVILNFGYSHIEKNAVATTISTADVYQDMNLTGSSGAISAFATNGAGGTTVTSGTHGLVENQNVEIEGTTSYNGLFRVFNITGSTYDIAIAFVADDATGMWFSRVSEAESNVGFSLIDSTINEIEYTGNEPFVGLVTYIIAVKKTGSNAAYLFSLAKNGATPAHVPFSERTITTALGSLSVSIPVSLVSGDTVKPQLAGVGTTNSITVQNLITSIQ